MREFELAFQPRVADYEVAIRAKRRATRVAWLDRGAGGLLALMCVPGLGHASPLAIYFFVFGLSLATGLYGRAYRWLFTYRRQPSMFLPTHLTLSEEGIRERDGHIDAFMDWASWKALLHLDDRLVLMTATGGNCGLYPLPRAALGDKADWPGLVELVEAHVDDHPRDPHPRARESLDRNPPARG